MLERRSAWLVVDTQVKACSRETHSPSRASQTYGHKAFSNSTLTHYYRQQWSRYTTQHRIYCGLRCGASLSADCGYNPG